MTSKLPTRHVSRTSNSPTDPRRHQYILRWKRQREHIIAHRRTRHCNGGRSIVTAFTLVWNACKVCAVRPVCWKTTHLITMHDLPVTVFELPKPSDKWREHQNTVRTTWENLRQRDTLWQVTEISKTYAYMTWKALHKDLLRLQCRDPTGRNKTRRLNWW